MDALTVMRAVQVNLEQRGVATCLEYPGTIVVSDKLPMRICFGTANETWMADVTEDDDTVIETLESTIPSDSEDVASIAEWITCIYSEALMTCGETREKWQEWVAFYSVDFHQTMPELAAYIHNVTGLTVDAGSDDLCATLTDAQLRAVAKQMESHAQQRRAHTEGIR